MKPKITIEKIPAPQFTVTFENLSQEQLDSLFLIGNWASAIANFLDDKGVFNSGIKTTKRETYEFFDSLYGATVNESTFWSKPK